MKGKLLAQRVICLATFCILTTSGATTIDFEAVPDSADVANTYASLGVHFSHAIGLTAGISLNEIDFPPHSGSLAVADDGSPLNILFDTSASQISAWFAHTEQLTFTAFDLGGATLGTYTDPVISNLGSDRLIILPFLGVHSLEITSTDTSTYVMDDFSFVQGQPIPDSSATISLLSINLVALLLLRKLVQSLAKQVSAGHHHFDTTVLWVIK